MKELKENIIRKKGNSKGQAILFAVVGVTIALALGVTVASRNLSSIARTSRSDTSAKAYAAAEGGIERLLALTDDQLALLNNATPSCTAVGFTASPTTGYCRLVFPSVSGDAITSVAEMKVEPYIYNQTDYLKLNLEPGFTSEVSLRGTNPYAGSVTICWNESAAVLYYFSYNENGVLVRNAIKSPLSSSSSTISSYGFTNSDGTTKPGFLYCKSGISLGTNPYGLRIKTVYTNATIGIFPSAALPVQGYKFTVNGMVLQQSDIQQTKKVTLYRSLPYMPSFFDAAIYSAEGIINN